MNNFSGIEYTSLGNDIANLLDEQCKNWDLCGGNYSNLSQVKVKTFTLKDKTVKLQWNPARLTSTSAKVDAKSISERKCFLCTENRPPVQTGIDFNQHFTVLVNPFPIFPQHFTIIHKRHIPQQIESHITELLSLSRALGNKFLVFYNGPQCGASAPDHHHFQAGNTGFLPIENEIEPMKKQSMATISADNAVTWFVNDGVRKIVMIEGRDASGVQISCERVVKALRKLRVQETEPLMNILSFFNEASEVHTLLMLVREKHRPASYFAEGSEQIMISPAAVDLGGVCVTPREEDFTKVQKEDLQKIFSEVFPSDEFFFQLQNEVSSMI